MKKACFQAAWVLVLLASVASGSTCGDDAATAATGAASMGVKQPCRGTADTPAFSRQYTCGDALAFSSRQELQDHTTKQKLTMVPHLIQWLLQNHGQVHVEVREAGPGAGLGLFASRAIKKGQVIMSFPTDLGFAGRPQENGVMDFLLNFTMDMQDPGSPRALMWATSPCPHELRHLLNFPKPYLPLLQHAQLEEWIGAGLHKDLQLFSRIHAAQLQAASISYDNLVHAMGLIGTRTFNMPDDVNDPHSPSTYYALPLLDMANHDNTCAHFNSFRPCGHDASRQCVYFTAGSDVAPGQEVCLFYAHLLQDRALLEYGFLQQQQQQPRASFNTHQQQQDAAAPEPWLGNGPAETATMESMLPAVEGGAPQLSALPDLSGFALPLFGIDRHDFDVDVAPLIKLITEPAHFHGTSASAIKQRIQELQQLLKQLESGDAMAHAVEQQGPAAGDEDGFFLQQLLQWRQLRQQAVAAEIGRLEQQLPAHS